jgi:hypothetical protein
MAIAYNTSIIKDGLVLCLDAANPKSYPGNLGAELVTTSTVTQIDGTTFNVIRDAVQNIALSLCNVESGKTYYVDYLITSYTGTVGATFRINNSGANLTPTISVGSTGRFNAKFTASASGGLTISGDNSGTNFLVDYVSVREVLSGTGTRWFDLSGVGNNGTLTNGPTYNTSNNGYMVFDGTNDYVTSSFATTSGQAVTYCGWLYSTETTSTYRNFVDSASASPMIWWNTSGQIEFDAAAYTTTPVYRNQWAYVALSKPSGSSSASYYVNGILVGTGSAYTTPAATPTWFNRAAAETWKGNSSVVQAYNRALTATEIRQNFEATRGRYGI